MCYMKCCIAKVNKPSADVIISQKKKKKFEKFFYLFLWKLLLSIYYVLSVLSGMSTNKKAKKKHARGVHILRSQNRHKLKNYTLLK